MRVFHKSLNAGRRALPVSMQLSGQGCPAYPNAYRDKDVPPTQRMQ